VKTTPFAALALASAVLAQVQNYKPVTQEMLLNPSPNDWLMYSRTYDAPRGRSDFPPRYQSLLSG
jgi:hypothetical protein